MKIASIRVLLRIDKPGWGFGGFANPPFSVKSGDSFAEFAENTAIAVFFSHSKNPSAKDEGLCRWTETCIVILHVVFSFRTRLRNKARL